jgi:hypothetical protein
VDVEGQNGPGQSATWSGCRKGPNWRRRSSAVISYTELSIAENHKGEHCDVAARKPRACLPHAKLLVMDGKRWHGDRRALSSPSERSR